MPRAAIRLISAPLSRATVGPAACRRLYRVNRGPIGDGDGPVLGYGGGPWGKSYDPILVHWATEDGKVDLPDLQLLAGLTPARLTDRKTGDSRHSMAFGAKRGTRWPLANGTLTPSKSVPTLTSRTALEAFDLSRAGT